MWCDFWLRVVFVWIISLQHFCIFLVCSVEQLDTSGISPHVQTTVIAIHHCHFNILPSWRKPLAATCAFKLLYTSESPSPSRLAPFPAQAAERCVQSACGIITPKHRENGLWVSRLEEGGGEGWRCTGKAVKVCEGNKPHGNDGRSGSPGRRQSIWH